MRYTKFVEHLYLAKLPTDEIQLLKSTTESACFFAVKYTSDTELIRRYGESLFAAGCFDFSVFGGKAKVWKDVLDQVQDGLNINTLIGNFRAAKMYRTLDDFCRRIDMSLSMYPSAKKDCYLFYDDEPMMVRVVERLREITGRYIWEG